MAGDAAGWGMDWDVRKGAEDKVLFFPCAGHIL